MLGLAGFLNLALLLTFTRSQWVASALALAVCLVLLPGRVRLALVTLGIGLVLVGGALFATQRERWAEFVSYENFASPLVERMESVFELDETLDSYSARTRYFQTDAALEAIRQEPWTDDRLAADIDAAAEWLRKHSRVRFVFTPKHGSWLNQVEIWFGILTRSALRHRSFASVAELATAIYRFGKYWNDVAAKPFDWTYSGRVLHA